MAQRQTLTEKQLELLRWIDNGCRPGKYDNHDHRISAAALDRRRLVKVTGHGPTWKAVATDAGKEYLKQADGPNPPIPRQSNTSVTSQLVAEIIEAGGSKKFPRRGWGHPDQIDYENRAALAIKYGKLPDGKAFKFTRTDDHREIEIEIVDAEPDDRPELVPVPVPETVGRYHPVVREFKQHTERHEVSRATLPRVMRLLQGLVTAAETRGFEVTGVRDIPEGRGRDAGWSGTHHGHLVISLDGTPSILRLREEGLTSRRYWDDRNVRHERYGAGWREVRPPLSEYEAKATGNLSLELIHVGYAFKSFRDRKTSTLEELLPNVLQAIEIRALEQAKRKRQEAERAEARERQWETEMQHARQRFTENERATALLTQASEWREAEQIRAYCDAADAAYPNDQDVQEWIAWARRYANALDPLSTPPQTPAINEDPKPDELQPFMAQGWSTWGPQNSWR